MAHVSHAKSAMKRVELSARYQQQNRMFRSVMKTAIKKYEAALEAGSADAEALLKEAVSIVDKAAAKGVIHKNAADHKKAQLARMSARA